MSLQKHSLWMDIINDSHSELASLGHCTTDKQRDVYSSGHLALLGSAAGKGLQTSPWRST